MSSRLTGRLIGTLFLAAFVCYGGGAAFYSGTAPASLPIGLALMLANSLAVIGIGVLVHRVLSRPRPGVARSYLAARTVEGVLLALGVAALATGRPQVNDLGYQLAMLGLAAGSILFCRTLHSDLRLPAWLAGWGAVGYLVLGIGMALQLLRLIGPTAGVLLSIPGGLFEIALGVTLAVNGLSAPSAEVSRASGRVAGAT